MLRRQVSTGVRPSARGFEASSAAVNRPRPFAELRTPAASPSPTTQNNPIPIGASAPVRDDPHSLPSRSGAQALTNRRQTLNRPRQPDLLAGVISPAIPPTPPGPPPEDNQFWIDTLRAALAERSGKSKAIAEQALKACPTDPELMLLSALTALASGESRPGARAAEALRETLPDPRTRPSAHRPGACRPATIRRGLDDPEGETHRHPSRRHRRIHRRCGHARLAARPPANDQDPGIAANTARHPEAPRTPAPCSEKTAPAHQTAPAGRPRAPRPAATRSPLRHDVRHRQSRRHRNRRRRPRPDPVPPARRTRPPLACSRNSTNCSACPRCTTSSRIGTRPKPSAKSSSNIAAASCWPMRSVSARPSRPEWC